MTTARRLIVKSTLHLQFSEFSFQPGEQMAAIVEIIIDKWREKKSNNKTNNAIKSDSWQATVYTKAVHYTYTLPTNMLWKLFIHLFLFFFSYTKYKENDNLCRHGVVLLEYHSFRIFLKAKITRDPLLQDFEFSQTKLVWNSIVQVFTVVNQQWILRVGQQLNG